jgi:hypothetical protein
MLRLACSLATEADISVIAPVHDALMVEGPVDEIDDIVARTQEAMAEASEVVLAGFQLRSDAKVVRWPDRYQDERGREFWDRVMNLLPSEAALESTRDQGIPTTFNEEAGEVYGHVDWESAPF